VLGLITQRFTEFDNTEGQGTVIHRRAGPQLLKQLGFGHYLPGMFNQIAEYRKRLVGQWNCPFAPPELCSCQSELVAIKGKYLIWPHFYLCLRLQELS